MGDLFPIITPNKDGDFLLFDMTLGYPGCDVCCEYDAIVKAAGTYFYEYHYLQAANDETINLKSEDLIL